ncbi:MAG: hypothetical protein E7163_00670 [Firmicutes bacterium]|nr:hypothetical protein [Bacillota bacterium]
MKKKKMTIVIALIILIMTVIIVIPKKEYKNEIQEENITNVKDMAFFIQNTDGLYQEEETIPENYILNTEKSVCSNGAVPIYREGEVVLTNLKSKNTQCFLYFDPANASSTILATIKETTTRTSFAGTNGSSTTGKIYKENTDEGTTYYYTGAPTDNYVKFANHYWRIIRINENGSIRMIYSGNVGTIGSNKETVLANGYNDSTTGYLKYGNSAFSYASNDSKYVGFQYESNGTKYNSKILDVLLNWYEIYIENKGYDKYIDDSAGFCGDRTAYTDDTGTEIETDTSTTKTYYGAYIRNNTNKTPLFSCPNSDDLYKTKVGLITAEEVAYAGGVFYSANTSYYLYTGYRYWTMSPSFYDDYTNEDGVDEGKHARLVDINENGSMGYGNAYDPGEGVRPVINLKAGLELSGDGTIDTPYEVIEAGE